MLLFLQIKSADLGIHVMPRTPILAEQQEMTRAQKEKHQ